MPCLGRRFAVIFFVFIIITTPTLLPSPLLFLSLSLFLISQPFLTFDVKTALPPLTPLRLDLCEPPLLRRTYNTTRKSARSSASSDHIIPLDYYRTVQHSYKDIHIPFVSRHATVASVLHLDGDGWCGLGPEIPLFCASLAMEIGKYVAIPVLADAFLVLFPDLLQNVVCFRPRNYEPPDLFSVLLARLATSLTILNSAHLLSSWVILCPSH